MWSVTRTSVRGALAGLGVAGAVVSCTVFDDVVVAESAASTSAGGALAGTGGEQSDGGAGGASSGVGGAAGAGGAEPKVGFLSVSQAATLCARIFACEQVGPSIRASIGLPVDASPTFSHCVHWLAGPLPRPPTAAQTKMLEDMAKGTDCITTRAAAYVEKLDEADPLCEGKSGRSCSGAKAVLDCARMQIEHCDNALLGESTGCLATSTGQVACGTTTVAIPGYECAGLTLRYYPLPNSVLQISGCPERGLACQTETIPFYCADEDHVVSTCTGTDPGDAGCQGEVAKVCADPIGTTPDQLHSPYDCTKVDGGALCMEEPAVHCEPAGKECSLTTLDECVGDTGILLCVGGNEEPFDCDEIGMVCLPGPARCAAASTP
jgi:hypothetical protein